MFKDSDVPIYPALIKNQQTGLGGVRLGKTGGPGKCIKGHITFCAD